MDSISPEDMERVNLIKSHLYEHAWQGNLIQRRCIVPKLNLDESASLVYLINNKKFQSIVLSSDDTSCVNCLFLQDGDLTNVLRLINNNLSIKKWQIHLVDENAEIIARNLLFIYAIITERTKYLWDIWYDHLINDEQHDYILELMSDIISELCTIDKVTIVSSIIGSDKVRCIILEIFVNWTREHCLHEAKYARVQRRQHIEKFLSLKQLKEISTKNIQLVLNCSNEQKIQQALNEIEYYIENGCTSRDDKQYANPTLLHHDSGKYTAHFGMIPYYGYLPFDKNEQEEFDKEKSKCPLQRCCFKTLNKWIKKFPKKEDIIIKLWYGDSTHVPLFSLSSIEFDLIYTSNMCDQAGLANILVANGPLLKRQESSVLITRYTNWKTEDSPDQTFGIPPSDFSAIFGLLWPKNAVKTEGFEYQQWRIMETKVDDLSLLFNSLDCVAERCLHGYTTTVDTSFLGIGLATPFTYYILLRQIAYRFGKRSIQVLQQLLNRSYNRFRAFEVTLKTLHAAFDDTKEKNILQFDTESMIPLKEKCLFKLDTVPILRLIIIETPNPELAHSTLSMISSSFLTEMSQKTANIGFSKSLYGTLHLETADIHYDICTGILTCDTRKSGLRSKSEPDRLFQLRIHIIDNFFFALPNKPAHRIKYENLALESHLQFAISTNNIELLEKIDKRQAGIALIDGLTWHPFSLFYNCNGMPQSIPNSYKMGIRQRDLKLLKLNSAEVSVCGACGQLSFDTKFRQCGKCKNIAYCSVDCQKSDWSIHKTVCSKA